MRELSPLILFLSKLGADNQNNYQFSLRDHLVGTYAVLRQWDMGEHVCLAGLFHSVYGTSNYDHGLMQASQRSDLVKLIGERAERLAYLFCCLNKTSLDEALERRESKYYIFSNRWDGNLFQISGQDFSELMTLKLANDIEILSQSSDVNKALYRLSVISYLQARNYLEVKVKKFCDNFFNLAEDSVNENS